MRSMFRRFFARAAAEAPRLDHRAISRLARAAERGGAAASRELGLAYLHGRGVLPNLPTAARWLTLAAEAGDVAAAHKLGELLLDGDGGQVGFAGRWFAAASQVDPRAAELNRDLLFPDGLALRADPVAAHRWAGIAAEAGHVEAQAHLGYLWAQGLGCERSYDEARRWYEKAAAAGAARAELGLGALLLNGLGCEADPEAARPLLARAARQGEPTAAYLLATLLLDREPRDEETASLSCGRQLPPACPQRSTVSR